MKTKINFQKQHLPIDLDLSSCRCIAKVKEGPVYRSCREVSSDFQHAKSLFWIHFNTQERGAMYTSQKNYISYHQCVMAERFKAVILVKSTFVRKRSNPDFDKKFFFFFFFFFLNVKIRGAAYTALRPYRRQIRYWKLLRESEEAIKTTVYNVRITVKDVTPNYIYNFQRFC